jgi:DNA-binding response OmpR family regulator
MSDHEIFPESGSASASLSQSQTNPPRRILVVDPDPYICHLSADVFIRHGYEVNAAEDGAAGWGELQANHYDLLITEHELPSITGVKLVRKLRSARMALPVILIARKLPARDLARERSLRPAATLLKPVAVDALLDAVRIVLHATDNPREQIAPPSTSPSRPLADGWELTQLARRAGATTRVLRETLDRCSPYSHWGLNE